MYRHEEAAKKEMDTNQFKRSGAAYGRQCSMTPRARHSRDSVREVCSAHANTSHSACWNIRSMPNLELVRHWPLPAAQPSWLPSQAAPPRTPARKVRRRTKGPHSPIMQSLPAEPMRLRKNTFVVQADMASACHAR